MPEVSLLHLDPELPLPSYARPGDAGLDLLAREGAMVHAGGGRAMVPTGIALAIPEGWAGFVLPRSGLSWKHGITIVNAPGLIDAGYRDEIKVLLLNTDPAHHYEVHRGDRIAQLVIMRVEAVTLARVDGFAGDHRGGGFGSTGR
ncbi:MAG TPA: dUTP diphosphatase [Acidimicrobiales bacterium]